MKKDFDETLSCLLQDRVFSFQATICKVVFFMTLLKRYLIFILGTVSQSAGIALVVKGLLGTSPISSIPYVLSLALPYTLGQTTFFINMLLVTGQIALLRRRFQLIQLLQVPTTFFFALLIDVFMGLFSWFEPSIYVSKILALLLGTTLVSLGVALQVIANVLMLQEKALFTLSAKPST